VLRADLEKTQTLAAKTQAGLEKTNAEKALLEADHQETKQNLARVGSRLADAVAHLQKLQTELDQTVAGLRKTKESLTATQNHIANKVDVPLQAHADELSSHDAALKATAQLLTATKRFSEESHDEFKGFVEATEKKDRKVASQFERTDERVAHLGTMLTETINRLNTHANHLRTTNGAVRPLQERFDKMAASQHETNNVQKNHSALLERLQGSVDIQGVLLDEMNGKFGNNKSETGIRDIYDDVLRLKSSVEVNDKNIDIITTQLNGAIDALPNHNKRLLLLEQGKQHHADQLFHLQNTVGVETKEVPAPPPFSAQEPAPAPARTLPKKIILEGPAIMQNRRFVDVVNQVSIKEKQKQYKDRLDRNERQLDSTNKMLEDTNRELHDKMGMRVKTLEAKMNNLVPTVDHLKAGMELTEEYWKGLSHGLRESHKMVAVNKELLRDQPRPTSARGKALPALNTMQRPTTPARNTQEVRNAWSSGAPASGRPPSAGRYPLGLAR